MSTRHTLPALVISALPLCFAAPAGAQGMMHGPGMMGHHGMGMMGGSRARHHYAMHHGLDPKYASLANPLAANADTLNAGKALYDQQCARCHGATGLGDGKAGLTLTPRPANLARAVRMRFASDGYLYWAISEGGVAFHTGMPAWKDTLKDADIWSVILYLRTLRGY